MERMEWMRGPGFKSSSTEDEKMRCDAIRCSSNPPMRCTGTSGDRTVGDGGNGLKGVHGPPAGCTWHQTTPISTRWLVRLVRSSMRSQRPRPRPPRMRFSVQLTPPLVPFRLKCLRDETTRLWMAATLTSNVCHCCLEVQYSTCSKQCQLLLRL